MKSMKIILSAAVIIFSASFSISAQSQNDFFRVDSIEISGNETTEEFIILRELTFGIGDTINLAALNFNRERVFSLGIFNRVDLTKKDSSNLTIINISVKESWYIYPVPFLDLNNGDIDRASYGFILLWKNFRGRDETVNFQIGFGFDPRLSFSYYNPVINEKYDLNFSFGFSYTNPSNRSQIAEKLAGQDFNYRTYIGSVGIGKRINQFNDITFAAGYQYVEQPFANLSGLTSSKTLIDKLPILKFGYFFDDRNLKQFSTEGIFAGVEYTHKGFGIKNSSYNIINFDFRQYRPLIDGIIGRWRVAGRHIFGRNLPFYDKSFLGYREYVRGHKNDYREGDNLMKVSFEVTYPLLEEWNFSVKLPLLPRKLTSARIAVYLEAFGDGGVTFNNTDKFALNNFDKGYGAGIIILFLPHNAFRLELGFDEFGNSEYLIGTGFSF